jgi:phenylalanyl-tRNA synthetase beta chain
MLISEHWLRAVVDPPASGAELAERLTMAGLEVESYEPVAPPFRGVVVGEVKSVERHPNADKLTVCQVEAGTGSLLNVVCGAPNVAPGIKVPCALEGAELPGGLKIKATTMRGVPSQGMLCSARELGLDNDHSGLLILAPDTPVGADARTALALDDHRFDIKLTPNRGDCLSVVGIAREVAAITGAALREPSWTAAPVTSDDRLPVRVLAPDLCGRFSGRVVRGLDARAPTPAWMRTRLERSGQRSISALVDISNYVMLELGRPTHVFDLAKVKGALEVRWGRAGESVDLLNGQTVTVDDWVGVIADDRGVEALAGVMGGEATAVTLDTTDIYLEAAFWWPESIQGRARRFNFSTDAAHRFERGTDYSTTAAHLEYVTRLIVDICVTQRTKVGPLDDQMLRLPERTPVRLRPARCRKLLGVDIADADIAAVFERLRLPVERDASGDFLVAPPPYRFDLQLEEDLIEEVARLWGFERLPVLPPRVPAVMRAAPEARRSAHTLRAAMADLGYQELMNFSFVDETSERDVAGNAEPLRVVNPIAAHMSVMRSTLIGGLLQALRFNLNRQATRVRVFEVGRVFRADVTVPDGPLTVGGIDQPMRLGALAYGPVDDEQWGLARRSVDFFDLKADVERLFGAVGQLEFVAAANPALHPGRSARIDHDGRSRGWIGELHPRWQQQFELPQAPVLFELDLETLCSVRIPSTRPVARYPAVTRDLAMWFAQDCSFGAIEMAVASLVQGDPRLRVLREVRLFDVYRGPRADSSSFPEASANALLNKEKSLAFRVILQDTERTLSDNDVDAAMALLIQALEAEFGARIRD